MPDAAKVKVKSLIQTLSITERLALYIIMFFTFAISAFTALWHGFLSEGVVLRSLTLAVLGIGVSFYLTHINVLPRRLLSGVILFYAVVILLFDMKRELGFTALHFFARPHSLISTSAQEAMSFLMAFILTLAALKHMQLLDPIDFSLVLLLELCIYTLMLPIYRSLSFVLFFIPYGILAVGALLLLQTAHLRFVAPVVELTGWEKAFHRSLLRTVLSLSGWVIVLSVILSYALTSFVRPLELLSQLSKFELSISERLSKYLIKAHSILSFYGFSISLRHPMSELSDTIVMRVKCDMPGYWRLCAYEYYKDGSWRRKARWHMRRLEKGEELILDLTDDRWDDSVQAEEVKQTIYIERCTLTYLPALFEPVRVDAALEWIGFDPSGTIRSRRLVTQGFSYDVWSKVKPFSAHKISWRTHTKEEIKRLSQYLQVPEKIKPQLRRIAERVIAGAATPWDKAQAIRRYLKRTFTYDDKAPLAPYEYDPVIYFLTISRRGICTHFASAMVLLCRVVGIPARFVTGFAIGEWDDSKRSFTVRERDAHAWAEVYIPPVGWVAIEATPGYSIPPPRRLSSLVEQEERDWFESFKENFMLIWEQYDVPISIALIALSLLAFSVFVLMHTPVKIRPLTGRRRLIRGEAVKLFEKALRIVAKHHRRRRMCETAIEYAMSTNGILPDEAQKALMRLAELFTEAIYSNGRQHNTSLMQLFLNELKEAMRRNR
ncbi:MAG: transglutaminaseTgpA domain-containing protein [Armatimonadota bacterium]|nr:transglutaminaseTgpA domain-containing protein [Armatimonadota bacterium]MCX7777968.1 transglutaminaseTgpA domain-containing protein [Armatimonadota bacterium]MDW8025275.1 transglutaminaseTgpA domain-containing protein [Armatimonadota bacterium]